MEEKTQTKKINKKTKKQNKKKNREALLIANLHSTSVKGVVRQNYLSKPQHGGVVDCPQLLA